VKPGWLKRRFGLHARRVAVRTHMPWYLRWLARGFVAVSVIVLVWIVLEPSRSTALVGGQGESALTDLRNQIAEREKANAALKSELTVLERQRQIERASYDDLARQVKELTHENARLREDVALVQAISAADSKVDGVKVSSARIEPNSVPGEYIYRIVLLQTGSRAKQFHGRYQLVVNLLHNGERRGMTLPGPGDSGDAPYQLDFRVHQRIDGTFRVDPGAVVRSVELRVFEGRQSQPKLMQTVTLS
jgi:cell division protein FtsB